MWQFHEMRLFMFARKHIKIFRNSRLSELETTVFGEMFVRIYFLNLFFFFISFYFAWVSKLVSSEKVKIILGYTMWFSLLFPKLRQAKELRLQISSKPDFLENC